MPHIVRKKETAEHQRDKAVFVSSIRFRGLQEKPTQIKFVGISHGDWPFRLTAKTSRIVRKELAEEPGLIVAEERSGSFIPLKYLKRTKALEAKADPISQFVLGKMPIWVAMRLVLNITKQQLSAPLREFFIKVEKIEGTSPRLKLTDEEVKKYSRILKVTPAEFYNGMKLLTTGRSLLMAAEIMRQATVGHGEKKMNSMTAVVGMRHMVEIQKFLTKPALAMRYATILERNLTKIKGTEAILAELRRAKRIFSQAQKN